MPESTFKRTPPRLDRVFANYDTPIYFVTFNTWQRQTTLDRPSILRALRAYAEGNAKAGRCMGRFVIMPDHVHAFVRLNREARLVDYIRLLKQALGKSLSAENIGRPHWQPGFFDHLLRHRESYTEKWHYVRQNPVRAGLVSKAEDWPYQGEVVRLEY